MLVNLYVDFFSNIPQDYTAYGWLNLWMWSYVYRGLAIKLKVGFLLCWGSVPLIPTLFTDVYGVPLKETNNIFWEIHEFSNQKTNKKILV